MEPKINWQVIKILLLFLLGAVIVCLFAILLWRTVDAHLLALSAVAIIPSKLPRNVTVIENTGTVTVLTVSDKKGDKARVRILNMGDGYDVYLDGMKIATRETPEFIARWVVRCARELG